MECALLCIDRGRGRGFGPEKATTGGLVCLMETLLGELNSAYWRKVDYVCYRNVKRPARNVVWDCKNN